MIFYFYGEDSYRAKQKIKAIIDKFKEKVDKSSHNIHHLDGEMITSEQFFQTVSASGFLAEKKLVVVKNLQDNKKLSDWQETLFKFLKNQKDSPDENYIIFWQAGKPDSRTKLYKRLKEFKFVDEFPKLSSTQLNKWVNTEVKKRSRNIHPDAVTTLITYIGNDLWQISNELDKLAALTKDTIVKNDVETLVQAKIDDNIFTLVDALGLKNKAQALLLLQERLESGLAPQYILTMIIRQFRLLIKVKAMAEKLPGASGLAQTLKVHPIVAEKALRQSKTYTISELKNTYRLLLSLDEAFKTSSKREAVLFAQMVNNL